MRVRLPVWCAIGAILLWPGASDAQTEPARDVALEVRRLSDEIRQILAEPSLDQDDRIGRKIAFAQTRQRFFLIYAILRDQWGVVVTPGEVATAVEPDLSKVELARTDVQPGASASASGSSSLISKGSGPSYFSAAVETGGLLKSANGTSTTFQGNLIGIFDAMSSKGYMAAYEDHQVTKFLRRFSFSFTLKNSDPEAAAGAEAAGPGSIAERVDELNRRLEQYSVRAIVGRNRRDPRDEGNLTALRKMMDSQGQAVLAALDDALEDLQVSDAYLTWISETVSELKAAPKPFFDGVLIKRLNLLVDLARGVESFPAAAVRAYDAYAVFLSARDTALENLEKKKLFSVEYVRTREAQDVGRSTARFIGEGTKGRWDLTLNAAYTADDSGTRSSVRFRDFQLGAEAARPLGDRLLRGQPGGPNGNPLLSFAFLYERLAEAATVTFGTNALPAPPGNLYIGQLRLTLPVGKSGVKVPLSVSFSNRNELIVEKQIRAHIGFTFNFDAIASAVRP
jgi:hypothetical protein